MHFLSPVAADALLVNPVQKLTFKDALASIKNLEAASDDEPFAFAPFQRPRKSRLLSREPLNRDSPRSQENSIISIDLNNSPSSKNEVLSPRNANSFYREQSFYQLKSDRGDYPSDRFDKNYYLKASRASSNEIFGFDDQDLAVNKLRVLRRIRERSSKINRKNSIFKDMRESGRQSLNNSLVEIDLPLQQKQQAD